MFFHALLLAARRPARSNAYESIRTAPSHPSIHNLGNVGAGGVLHALTAGVATRVIDAVAYGGLNMRRDLAARMAASCPPGTTLLEVGCGTGTLTRELARLRHFDLTAVDTSAEMLDVAARSCATPLFRANGVDFARRSDMSVACMVMHELPPQAHRDLLATLMRQTAGDVWIVDIDPSYRPSVWMLSGEPYLASYLEGMERALREESGAAGRTAESVAIVPSHVRAWVLRRAEG